MKQSLLPNKPTKVDTGGSQKMTLTPITVGREESYSITSRTLRARTEQTKDIMGMIAGNSCDTVSTQTYKWSIESYANTVVRNHSCIGDDPSM